MSLNYQTFKVLQNHTVKIWPWEQEKSKISSLRPFDGFCARLTGFCACFEHELCTILLQNAPLQDELCYDRNQMHEILRFRAGCLILLFSRPPHRPIQEAQPDPNCSLPLDTFQLHPKTNSPFLPEFARLCTKGVRVLEKGRIRTMSNWAKIYITIEGSGFLRKSRSQISTRQLNFALTFLPLWLDLWMVPWTFDWTLGHLKGPLDQLLTDF